MHNRAGSVRAGALIQAGTVHQVVVSEMTDRRPRQLPPAMRDFIGRDRELAALDALLADAGTGAAVVITAVDGLAGVGKTALAVQWAHRVSDRFPDGVLYADLHGYGLAHQAEPQEVLDGFLRALGVRPEGIPLGECAKTQLFRSLTAEKRLLVLLDNANSAEQVRPLLPGGADCFVLVTSRDRPTGLVAGAGATRLELDVLPPADATRLVSAIVGKERAAAERDALGELTRRCAGLPLALRMAGSRIATRSRSSIEDLLADMGDDDSLLDTLSAVPDERTAVRPVFDWSYRKLTADQARFFRRLGLHPGADIEVHAAAAVAGVPATEARRLLDELAEVHLIEPAGAGRYQFHDLLRAHAAGTARRVDPPEDRERALDALLAWYTHTGCVANRVLYPIYIHWVDPELPPPGTEREFTDADSARAWLVAEHANVHAVIRHAAEAGRFDWVVRLVHTVESFLFHYAYWDETFTVCALGIDAAQRTNNPTSRAVFLTRSGWCRLQVGDWTVAVTELRQALDLARELGDAYLECNARNDLGTAHVRAGCFAEALAYLKPAITLSRGTDRGRQEAFVHCNVSAALVGLNRPEEALHHARESIRLREQAADHEGMIFSRYHLALALQPLHRHEEVVALGERALRVPRELIYEPDLGAVLDAMGTSLLALGDPHRAHACWTHALSIYERFADRRIHDLRARMSADPQIRTALTSPLELGGFSKASKRLGRP